MKFELPYKLKVFASLVLAASVFGYMFFISVRGLFLEEVEILVSRKQDKYLVYAGYPKFLVCIISAMLSGSMLILMIRGLYYRMFYKIVQPFQRFNGGKLFLVILAVSMAVYVFAYIWQSLDNPVYRYR
jgi:hypothetical protein